MHKHVNVYFRHPLKEDPPNRRTLLPIPIECLLYLVKPKEDNYYQVTNLVMVDGWDLLHIRYKNMSTIARLTF